MRKLAAPFLTSMLAMLGLGVPAHAQTRIAPYIEVQQVLDADFNNGGDVLTYSTVAAGVDGSVRSKRVEAQISYRYEHRFGWNHQLNDEDVHSGIARARADVVPNLLSLEGGAIATRAREDIRGAAPVFLTGNTNNVTQIYGVYAGPDLATHAGPLSINGSYRFGYVAVDDNNRVILPSGQPRLDRYSHATSHDVNGSIGMPSGRLPFGWTVSGGYTQENASQLDQRYVGRYARGDVTLPVAPHLALTGGAGYEKIRITERAALRDANGLPLLDGAGRFVTDPSSPRLLAYQTDGLIWDLGAIWRPNRRTTVQVRGGHRYGGRMITGSVDYQLRRNTALRVGVYDTVDSFGRALLRSLVDLPTSFNVSRNPLTGDFNGCIFGTTPGTGACFDDALQSVTTANYRSRGVYALLSSQRGPWSIGIGGGYANHKYLAPRSTLFNVDGVTDESATFQADVTRQLSSASGVSADLFGNWYRSGINRAPSVTSIGASVSYYRYLIDHLYGFGSVGLYNSRIQHQSSDTHGEAIIGLRYQF